MGYKVRCGRTGRHVTLVLSADDDGKQLSGRVYSIECSSAGLAERVRARVLRDLEAFPERQGDILRVSLLYAEAERRFANRRRFV